MAGDGEDHNHHDNDDRVVVNHHEVPEDDEDDDDDEEEVQAVVVGEDEEDDDDGEEGEIRDDDDDEEEEGEIDHKGNDAMEVDDQAGGTAQRPQEERGGAAGGGGGDDEDEEGEIPEEEEQDTSNKGNRNDDDGEVDHNEETTTGGTADAAAATASKHNSTDLSYSTRGRQVDMDPLERLAREEAIATAAVGLTGEAAALQTGPGASGAGGGKEPHTPVTTLRESFLSDSLTEEERRTRTRYIPNVEGMHMLRKSEIKGDLALARTILTASGAAGTLVKSKRKAAMAAAAAAAAANVNKSDDDAMDVDEYDAPMPSEDERLADVSNAKVGTHTITVGSAKLAVPSPAFAAPSASQLQSNHHAGAGDKEGGDTTLPSQVEAVAAFNPPRPPESIGPKKKHRMLRWERRPADMEVDLANYRKTVQRTRQELKVAEAERDRLEAVDGLLRRHLLNHISCLNEEATALNEELTALQQECVSAADLLTSRTRSRGAGKGSYAMRDVLAVLRSRGDEIASRGLPLAGTTGQQQQPSTESKVQGVGGIRAVAFQDWNRATTIESSQLASAWIVPGDRVKTPYGQGNVVAMLPCGTLNPKETPHPSVSGEEQNQPEAMDIDKPQSTPSAGLKTKSGQQAGSSKDENHSILRAFLPPRVVVRLAFGIGYFTPTSLQSLESPASYSDARLALRWKGLMETAVQCGDTLDIEAMADRLSSKLAQDNDAMQVEDLPSAPGTQRRNAAVEGTKKRLVPFGSNLLPTANGRGALLLRASFDDIEDGVENALFETKAVLGKRDNMGVPKTVRDLEDQNQEHVNLQAKALQLRNELYRQRRIRMLNERTHAATQERASRVESLVSEMRMDLKNLKSRLDDEIRELGIGEEEAESILTSYYRSLDSQHAGEPTPPKRQRRTSRMEYEEEDEADDDAHEDSHAEPAEHTGARQ